MIHVGASSGFFSGEKFELACVQFKTVPSIFSSVREQIRHILYKSHTCGKWIINRFMVCRNG
jgi:hypothetical protein